MIKSHVFIQNDLAEAETEAFAGLCRNGRNNVLVRKIPLKDISSVHDQHQRSLTNHGAQRSYERNPQE